jgi:hypothetical protein
MSDTVIFGEKKNLFSDYAEHEMVTTKNPKSNLPSYKYLETGLSDASKLVDDIVLKKYLHKLTDLEIIPLDDSLKKISDIRIFKITEMVYQNNEYSTYKFASVFNAVQNLNCGVFVIIDSNEDKTDFYMGVRSLDDKRTTKSLKDTLENALSGQFPGVKTHVLLDSEAEELLGNIEATNIASVSCIANNKDDEFKDNDTFIQGLEKLVFGMQGKKYTAIILAKSTPNSQLEETRQAYESIYTQLSPFANMQISYGKSTALSVSDAFSRGTSTGSAHSVTSSSQKGSSYTKGTSESNSTSQIDTLGTLAKGLGTVALGVASVVSAPLTGGVSFAAAGAITAGHLGLSMFNPKTNSEGTSRSESYTENTSESYGKTDTENESRTENETRTKGTTTGSSDNMQLNLQNKSLINTLEKIDLQLKRIDECESIGMWECAAYFLSDSQETSEMAASTYKALMKGEKSGVEASSINFWGRKKQKEVQMLSEYITNFIHPVFQYRSETLSVPVTASSLVSSNELAIQMGLPRKSVCGFPVIEHAPFAQEVITRKSGGYSNISIGNIYHLGHETETEVDLDMNSLAMHTFVTGSTGSGKSNAVYHIIGEARKKGIPFLVVEPAKGEYKNVFADVNCYGTNPKQGKMLRINPFSFPEGIHVLEHIDRIVEIFNVCWAMYAAMPAVLKDSIEQAYISAGWDLDLSENTKIPGLFPTFDDVLRELNTTIRASDYSADTKSDYIGALSTRIKSLTNGINGRIFVSDEMDLSELFDKSAIIDISRVGSMETKSLIMGLAVLKLQEYRMANADGMNVPLRHITVLEEAHNLLKKTSTEQSAESSNLLGKSVEMLTNAIAEIRTYGEGFVIVDQAPNLLDTAAIRNTNTKIVLRLPESTDREITGGAMALNEQQFNELSKLPTGVAAVYQNDWQEAVLCSLPKYEAVGYHSNKEQVINNLEVRKNNSSKLLHLLLKKDMSAEELEYTKELIKISHAPAKVRKDLILNLEKRNINFEWAVADFIHKNFEFSDVFRSTSNSPNFEEIINIMRQNIKDEFEGFDDSELDAIMYHICRIEHEKYPENKTIEKLRNEYLKEKVM